MADTWAAEADADGYWEVVDDGGDTRYVKTEDLNTRKAEIRGRLRTQANRYEAMKTRLAAELAQIDADLAQIAILEAP